jgi:hypothetical protein
VDKGAWQAARAALDSPYAILRIRTYKKESTMKNHLVNLALGIAAGLALSAALYGPIVLGAAQ